MLQPAGSYIVQTYHRILSAEDRLQLLNLRNRKRLYLFSTYGVFLLVFSYAWLYGFSGGRGHIKPEQFERVAPIFFSFSFILLTVFFVRYWMQTVHQFNKDLRRNEKEVIEFACTKYQMGFFNRYYLKTPLEKKQVVEISKETFEKLFPAQNLVFEVAPYSKTIFNLKAGGENIHYWH
jgi:hypothetical protein